MREAKAQEAVSCATVCFLSLFFFINVFVLLIDFVGC